MTRNIKHYRVGMDSETLAISLVDEGAIEMDFIALKKQEEPVEIKMANEEKHIVIGCVLCPDKPIYRNQDGEEFYITFDKDVIRKMAFDYLANDRQHNVTLQHQEETKGAVMVESWIKEGENDKSDYYGLQAPVGSWLCTMKINDNKIWQGIKNGEFNGFSIESLVQVEDIDLSKVKNNNTNKNTKMAKENINMEQVEVNDSFWDKLKSIIADALKSEPKEGQEADNEAEQAVEEVKDEVVPSGETSGETVEAAEEEVPSGETESESGASQVADEVTEEVKEVVEENAETPEDASKDLQSIIDSLKAEVEALKGQVEQMKKENADLKDENMKLSKQPSTKPANLKAEHKLGDSRNAIEELRNRYRF